MSILYTQTISWVRVTLFRDSPELGVFFWVNFEPVSMPPCRAVSVSTHAWQRPSGRMVVLGSFLSPENGDLKSKNGSLSSKNDDLSIKDGDLTMDVQFLRMWMDLPWIYQEFMGRQWDGNTVYKENNRYLTKRDVMIYIYIYMYTPSRKATVCCGKEHQQKVNGFRSNLLVYWMSNLPERGLTGGFNDVLCFLFGTWRMIRNDQYMFEWGWNHNSGLLILDVAELSRAGWCDLGIGLRYVSSCFANHWMPIGEAFPSS